MATKQKVYELRMAGQGDVQVKLINKAFWDYISNVLTAKAPADLAIDWIAERAEDPDLGTENIDEWVAYLPGHKKINEIAMAAPASLFNGKRFDEYGCGGWHKPERQKLNKFLKKHNLEIEDGWEGYLL
jgi:hypothetical protein